MKLNAPKKVTFWVAVAIAALGLVANLVTIPVVSGFSFWLVLVGFVLLALSNVLSGL